MIDLLKPEQKEIGREINPFLLTSSQWRRKLAAGNAFVTRVAASKKVFLIGDADELDRLAKKKDG